jgi:DedD protein
MMERALKERIVGAVVLVIFVVLVVPIFLDGPPGDDEIVSERVLLPGQDDQKSQTVVLDRNRSEPVPAAESATPQPARGEEPDTAPKAAPQPQPAAAESRPEPAKPEPEPEPEPQPEPKRTEPPASKPAASPPAASPTGMWAVQLGSFSNKENAEDLAASLRKQGYAAFVSQLQTDSGVLHRVRIGPQKDRASAEAMAARLAKVGHDGKVMQHP